MQWDPLVYLKTNLNNYVLELFVKKINSYKSPTILANKAASKMYDGVLNTSLREQVVFSSEITDPEHSHKKWKDTLRLLWQFQKRDVEILLCYLPYLFSQFVSSNYQLIKTNEQRLTHKKNEYAFLDSIYSEAVTRRCSAKKIFW